MLELGSSVQAKTIIISTRVDRWDSREQYENVIASLPTLHPKRIVLLSSVSVYGDNKLPRNEDSKIQPVTKYGRSKVFEEQALLRNNPESCELSILRISNVFGHRLFDDFVNHVFLSAKRSDPVRLIDQGRTTRNFIWLKDLINILIQLLNFETLPQYLNIGSQTSINLQSLILEIEIILEKRITIVESNGDLDIAANSIIDTSQLNTLLDFETTEIVLALQNYFLENSDLASSL
jgi:nucleoside-diphosphate-sugar epimerase